MRKKPQPLIVVFALYFIALFPKLVLAGVPEVNHIMVTDVTTRSFSVIWASSQPSTSWLEVFADEGGNLPVPEAVMTPTSSTRAIRQLPKPRKTMGS